MAGEETRAVVHQLESKGTAAMKTVSFAMLLLTAFVAGAAANVRPVTPVEEKALVRHLIPLPHEIRIARMAALAPGDVRITVRPGATEIEKNAAAELSALFRERTGKEPSGNGFEIRIGVNDSRMGARLAARLKSLPNHEQAYAVIPDGSGRIVLTGLDGRGVYYAARTFYQLLEASLSRDTAAIPLAEITDWPDLDERGLWNFGQPEVWIPWMASLKLNYAKMVNTTFRRSNATSPIMRPSTVTSCSERGSRRSTISRSHPPSQFSPRLRAFHRVPGTRGQRRRRARGALLRAQGRKPPSRAMRLEPHPREDSRGMDGRHRLPGRQRGKLLAHRAARAVRMSGLPRGRPVRR